MHFSQTLLKNNKVKHRFLDAVRLQVRGGAGGQGLPRFGGRGGKGGNVYVVGHEKTTIKKITQAHPNRRISAGKGQNSSRRALLGQPGAHVELPVPLGVSVENDAGRVLGDINNAGDQLLVAKGGAGGDATNNFFGEKGHHLMIKLNLKLIADVGLVGFPNAGKSTLLSAVSRASPKIASYPFTTIRPQLGCMIYDDLRQISMADLPGLIEGAHMNVGMGHSFLKHVERTKLLLFVVDVHGFQLNPHSAHRDAFSTVLLLNKELELYRPDLVTKPAILAVNKMDTEGADEKLEEIQHKLKHAKKSSEDIDPHFRPSQLMNFGAVLPLSAKKRDGIQELRTRVRTLLDMYADIALEQQGGDSKDVSDQLVEHFPVQLV